MSVQPAHAQENFPQGLSNSFPESETWNGRSLSTPWPDVLISASHHQGLARRRAPESLHPAVAYNPDYKAAFKPDVKLFTFKSKEAGNTPEKQYF